MVINNMAVRGHPKLDRAYLSGAPPLLEGSDVLAVLGIEQAEQSAVTEPLVRAGNGGRVQALLVTVATGVWHLNGMQVPSSRRHAHTRRHGRGDCVGVVRVGEGN